jgi:hypothetical protein
MSNLRLRSVPSVVMGLALLLAGGLEFFYPRAVTIIDEVYYLGQAHALADGRITPDAQDPFPTDDGKPRVKYPLGWPLALAPFMLVSTDLALAVSGFCHLAAMGIFALLLRRRGLPILYSVLFLFQPGLYFYSRTSMAESFVVLITMAALFAAEHRRWIWVGVFLGLAVNIRLGAVVLCGGYGIYLVLSFMNQKIRGSVVAASLLGMSLPLFLLPLHYSATSGVGAPTVYLNEIQWGSSLQTLLQNGGFYGISLLLLYPGLLFALKRATRFERTLIGTLLLFHSAYFFHDSSRTLLESLIVGQRLILPAIAILLLGYAAMIESTAKWFRAAPALILGIAFVGAWGVGLRFGQYQEEFHAAARQIDRALPEGASLAYDPEASKLLPLLNKPERWMPVIPDEQGRVVVAWPYYLAAEKVGSYRLMWTLTPRVVKGETLVDHDLARLYKLPQNGGAR